jgi:hypothetical protein
MCNLWNLGEVSGGDSVTKAIRTSVTACLQLNSTSFPKEYLSFCDQQLVVLTELNEIGKARTRRVPATENMMIQSTLEISDSKRSCNYLKSAGFHSILESPARLIKQNFNYSVSNADPAASTASSVQGRKRVDSLWVPYGKDGRKKAFYSQADCEEKTSQVNQRR